MRHLMCIKTTILCISMAICKEKEIVNHITIKSKRVQGRRNKQTKKYRAREVDIEGEWDHKRVYRMPGGGAIEGVLNV